MTRRPKGIAEFVVVGLATGLGLGFVPAMPGTAGTLLGLPIGCAIDSFSGRPLTQIIACVALFVIGIPICARGARFFEREDPGEVVFDEIAALPLAFLFVPFTWKTALIGFVWFRVFDIAKPWPIRRVERAGGGFGIMADDTVAGLFAALATWLTSELLY